MLRKTNLTISIVSLILLSGCGNGDSSSPTNPPANPPVVQSQAKLVKPAKAGDPLLFQAGSNVSFSSATAANGSTTVNVQTKDATYKTLVDKDGLLQESVNEMTGEMIIPKYFTDRVYLLRYNKDKKFLGGVVVFQQGIDIMVGDVQGLPVFDGQLTADVQGSGSTASFSVVPDATAGIINIRKVDASTLSFVNKVIPTVAKATAKTVVASPTAIVGGIDVNRVTTYALMGALVGSTIPVAGTVVGGFAGASLGILGQIVASNNARVEAIGTCIANIDSCNQSSLDIGSSVGMALFGGLANNENSSDLLKDLINNNKDNWAKLKGTISSAFDTAKDKVPDLLNPIDTTILESLPVSVTNISGVIVNNSGNSADISGTIDKNGTASLTGKSADNKDVNLGLTVKNLPPFGSGNTNSPALQVSGTMSGTYGTGTINSGDQQPLGECNQVQQSGGQGTFSYAHILGNGVGSSTFSYDAYSIPDAFTVTYGNGQKFATGGLVSGDGSSILQLGGKPTVFVTVSAPNNGTQWEYAISCPQS